MSSKDKEVITAGICKLVTDATYAKIDAQKQLFDLEIKSVREDFKNLKNGIRNQIVTTVTLATLFLMALELGLRLIH